MDDTRHHGKIVLAEQRFNDPTLDAEILLKVVPGSTEPYRLQLRFAGSNEVRELRFGVDGMKSGSSTKTVELPEPVSRLRLVK